MAAPSQKQKCPKTRMPPYRDELWISSPRVSNGNWPQPQTLRTITPDSTAARAARALTMMSCTFHRLTWVVAILRTTDDFTARSSDELSLAKGDRVELLERDDEFGDGWFLGKHLLNPNSGLFPEGTSTSLLPSSHEHSRGGALAQYCAHSRQSWTFLQRHSNHRHSTYRSTSPPPCSLSLVSGR